MKRITPFLLLLLLSASVQAQSVTSEDLEQRDNLWYRIGTDTPFTGELHDEGELQGRIENGQRIGRWTSWHQNGNMSSESEFDAGVMSYHAMYYPDGATRFQGTFTQGRQHGTSKTWYPTGELRTEIEYNMGQRHGEYALWAPQGTLLYSARYTAGQLDGPAIWWYNNGQKRWATYYKRGKKWGVWTQWAPKGNIIGQSDWKDGEMVARQSVHQH